MTRPASGRSGGRHTTPSDQRSPRPTRRRLRLALVGTAVVGTALGVGLSPAGAHTWQAAHTSGNAIPKEHVRSWGAVPKPKAPAHAPARHAPAHHPAVQPPSHVAHKPKARGADLTVCPHLSITPKLVPTCGAWWGAATKAQTYAGYTNLEHVIGRKLDITYHYRSVNNAAPSKSELQLANTGHTLHLDLEPRGMSWSKIAAGGADASLRKGAAAVKNIGKPVFMTFDAEADRSNGGSPAQFVAAWRHVHQVYASAGASNAIWVWILTGYVGNKGAHFAALWPGTQYVDWIGWDAYNWANCHGTKAPNPAKSESFATVVSRFYNWVRTDGKKLGIDPNKPYMIGETSSAYFKSNPGLTTDWFKNIPAGLKQYPNIKAVQIWDSTFGGSCNFSVSKNAASMAGFTAAGHDRWVNLPH